MAMKRYALLGIGAAGYAYFKNKANRDKARDVVNESKGRLTNLVDQAKTSINDFRGKEPKNQYNVEDNKMMAEGAQTSVHYFNEKQAEREEKTSN